MGSAIRGPTEDTGKVTEGTAPGRTRRDRTTGAAQGVVSEEAVTLVGDRTGITAEAEVRKRTMLKTPNNPTRMDRECGTAVRTVRKEVGWRRENDLIGGMGK